VELVLTIQLRSSQGVINATGPFSDGVRRLDEPMVKEIVAPSAGVHITLPVRFGTSRQPLHQFRV
jgi:glycerol-3-phosphate dehydrogenase